MPLLRVLKSSFCFLIFSFISFFANAAELVTMRIDSVTSTANTIEFTVNIVNDGTTALSLGSYQFGINFNSAIITGGTPAATAFTYLSGTRHPAFSAFGMSASYVHAVSHLKATSGGMAPTFINLPSGIPMSLGRFRFTIPGSWAASSAPNLQFQLVAAGSGRLRCLAFCYINPVPPPGVNVNTGLESSLGTLNAISNTGAYLLNVPLPISILHFTGIRKENVDELEWSTSQEKNNSYFLLQKSNDNIRFETIANIATKAINGNSDVELNYSFAHSSSKSEKSYYKLLQVDIDGTTAQCGNIIMLASNNQQTRFTAYPNPMHDELFISCDLNKDAYMEIAIFDLMGRRMQQYVTRVNAGFQTISQPVHYLPKGNYIVSIIENRQTIYSIRMQKN